jgi:hypothetical protein
MLHFRYSDYAGILSVFPIIFVGLCVITFGILGIVLKIIKD